MELTAHQVEALASSRLDKDFWTIIENNGMVTVPTHRGVSLVVVRKAARHPGYYLVTAA